MTFHEPSVWFLLLLALVPLIWRRNASARHRGAVRYSSTEWLARLGGTWISRGRHAVPILRMLTTALLVVCLARPQKGNEQTRVFAEGIAIQLIVDRSGSMQAMDFQDAAGQPADRLTAVKDVVRQFALGGETLPGRPDDLIGLIAFGTYPDSICPLTLDHDHLTRALDTVEIATTQHEGATAIGDAIALGVERLRMLEERRNLITTNPIKSKIIILLTDGENTAGDIEPLQAAEIAAAFDIKVYTIGAGTQGFAPFPGIDIFGQRVMRQMPVKIDEAMLRQIAETTHGQYFRATDSDSLHKVYAEVDRLERTKVEEKRYMQYKELATASVQLGSLRLPPLLTVVLMLLGLEIVLANTRFRKIP